MKGVPRLLAIILILPVTLSALTTAVKAEALIWAVTSNPSTVSDAAHGIAIDGTGVYIVGRDESLGDSEWRIEKRSRADGSLIWSRTSNPSGGNDGAYDVAVDGSGVYVVGYENLGGTNYRWRIEKRSLTDGAFISSFGGSGVVTSDPSGSDDRASGAVVDGSAIYIAGYDAVPGDWEWRIEKRSLTDGSLTWSQTGNPSGAPDGAYDVAVDGSGVYVAGYDGSLGPPDHEWRIEKRSLTDGTPIWTQTSNPSGGSDIASGVVVDGTGVYIAGYTNAPADEAWRIEKRSLADGSLTWSETNNPTGGWDRAYDVAVDSSGVYVIGYDNSPGGTDHGWRIEKRSLTTGALISSFGTGGFVTSNPSSADDIANGVAVDTSGIYVVGLDGSPGNPEWRIERRSLGLPASKLQVTVYPSSVTANSWTSIYTVQRQDAYGNPVTSGSTTVNLASTSTGAAKKFAETPGGFPVTSVTILDGTSTEDFYYYDELAGTWTISVSATGLTGDSKSLTVNPKTGCVIATAAYGSELAHEVTYMRHVRDEMIGSNEVGRSLVDGWNSFYYSWSPPLAQLITTHNMFQQVFRLLLLPLVGTVHLTGLIYSASVPVSPTSASIVAFLFAAASSTMVYVVTPILTIKTACRRQRKA